MPIFDFECPNCKHIEEQNTKEPEKAICSKCGAEMKKVFLSAAKVHIQKKDQAAP